MGIRDIIFSNFYKKPQAFGLDISDASIKIAQFKKRGEDLRLRSYNRVNVSEGIIKQGEILRDQELINLIKKTFSEVQGKKIKTRYAVCSLPEQHSFIKIVQLPRMEIKDLQNALKWEVEANIPFPLNEVYLDWQIIEPVKNHLDHFDILINAVPKKLVDKYLQVLQAAGIEPIVFETESLATIRSLIKNEFSFKPILIIDFGYNRSSFVIFAGSSIRFTSSIPVSNFQMINEIADKLGISFEQARTLKFKIGLNKEKDKGKIFNILLPLLTKLTNQIKECIAFHSQHTEHEHGCIGDIAEIILCGGGANLSGLPEYLSSWLKIPVILGNPWLNIFSSADGKNIKKIPNISYEESLSYTTVFGLALRGTSPANFN
jgi:type IV pilus assembly protein PilM